MGLMGRMGPMSRIGPIGPIRPIGERDGLGTPQRAFPTAPGLLLLRAIDKHAQAGVAR